MDDNRIELTADEWNRLQPMLNSGAFTALPDTAKAILGDERWAIVQKAKTAGVGCHVVVSFPPGQTKMLDRK